MIEDDFSRFVVGYVLAEGPPRRLSAWAPDSPLALPACPWDTEWFELVMFYAAFPQDRESCTASGLAVTASAAAVASVRWRWISSRLVRSEARRQ